MTEQSFESPYLRFAGRQATPGEDLRGPFVTVVSERNGLSCRLHPDEYELAQLFDGQTGPAARLDKARQDFDGQLGAMDLERFAHMLADAGLLWAGAEETAPVPAQTDAEAARLEQLRLGPEHEQAFPPSTSPGTLGSSNLAGPIAGSPFRPRDARERIDWPLDPRRWLWLGRLFSQPLYLTGGMIVLVLLVGALLVRLWMDQIAAAADFQRLLLWHNLVFVGAPSAALTNLVTQLARAAAVERESGRMPRFGLQFFGGLIPRFVTDTEGAAEELDRAARMRVIASSLTASLSLFVSFALGWFLVRQGTTMLPAALITAALFGLGNALLRINPLARTDGYYLLGQALRIPDLREQAVLAMLGRRERWGNRKPPPAGPVMLYALLALLFMITAVSLILAFPVRWLEASYGGPGIALVLAAIGLFVINLRRQFADRRGHIGGGLPLRSRLADSGRLLARRWALFVVVAIIALWPYTYEPGGRFLVLPAERADVPVEVAGTVLEVAVEEGDWVESGAVIVRIDDQMIASQRRAAEARVRQIEAELDQARNGATAEEIELARQRVATARARQLYSQAEAERAAAAHARGAVTAQERDRAQAQAEVHHEELSEAEVNLALVESPTRPETIAALEAELAREQAQLESINQEFERTRVKAPIAGRVVSETLRFARGRYVSPGDVIAVLENTRRLQAQISLPEFAARHVRVGAAARIRAWNAPVDDHDGTVVSVAPSAEVGENGRIIRVLVDIQAADGVLQPEMSGQAKVVAGKEPLAVAFSRAIVRFLMIELWSWLP